MQTSIFIGSIKKVSDFDQGLTELDILLPHDGIGFQLEHHRAGGLVISEGHGTTVSLQGQRDTLLEHPGINVLSVLLNFLGHNQEICE